MFQATAAEVWETIAHGGPTAIIALLFAALVLVLRDRQAIIKAWRESRDKMDERYVDLVEKSHEQQMSSIQTMKSLELVLVRIEAKQR